VLLSVNTPFFWLGKFPHSHPSGSTDTARTPCPPLRLREARKTSVPEHVHMVNNTPMDSPRKEFQPLLTHAPDGNKGPSRRRETTKSPPRFSIKPVRIIQPCDCFAVADGNHPNIFLTSKSSCAFNIWNTAFVILAASGFVATATGTAAFFLS